MKIKDEIKQLKAEIITRDRECAENSKRILDLTHDHHMYELKCSRLENEVDFLRQSVKIQCCKCKTQIAYKDLKMAKIERDGKKLSGYMCDGCFLITTTGLEEKKKMPALEMDRNDIRESRNASGYRIPFESAEWHLSGLFGGAFG